MRWSSRRIVRVCPKGSDRRRPTAGKPRRSSLRGEERQVSGRHTSVCKSIAKASKVRILHLAPRAREGA